MRNLCGIVLIGSCLVACRGAQEPASAPVATIAEEGATIEGTVRVDGDAPPYGRIRLDADPQCPPLAGGSEQPAEDVVIGAHGELQNAFVYVKEGLPTRSYAVGADAVVLDQQKCRFVPRVLGLQVGQRLLIRNSDPLLHTVRAEGVATRRFNLGMPVQNMEVPRAFDRPEIMVPIRCDMHPWMQAWIGVLEHPFFDVTDEAGAFSLRGLPPGTYVVEVWHERLGTTSAEVRIGERESRNVTFAFSYSES
jgi:hypothetical protein